MPPPPFSPPTCGREGSKISEKFLLGGVSEKFILVGVGGEEGGNFVVGGGHVILKWKLKLHNSSIKSTFGITNLIYFRYIGKMHPLSSYKISFSMAIWHKCLEHSAVFPAELFWSNLNLMFPQLAEIPGYEDFSHPFWELKHFFWSFFA